MTLKELSPLYLESARLISERMSLLRRQRRETDDPQERFRLERRLLELRPMLTQMNQLAELTARYYERGMTVMGTTRYDPLDRASLQLWMEGRNDDNHLQLERLLRNLPLAVEQELTPRQRQILRMRYSSGMRNVEIARALGVNKSTVTRTLNRAVERLFRTLRYSL